MGYRELSPELQAVAERELHEDPRRRDQDIKDIKEWLRKQPHITARTDDQWLLSFLRGCKFSMEKTKRKLDMHYTMRTALPELFGNRDPFSPACQKVLSSGTMILLPKPDAQGRRVLVMRPGLMPPNSYPAEDSFKVNMMGADVTLWTDDNAVVCGEVSIQDLQGVTLGHIAPLTPWFMKRAMTAYQEGYPLRSKAIHIINCPSGIEKALAMFQGFMKEKMKKRVTLHTSLDTLLDHFPKDVLPNEYGGTGGSLKDLQDTWKKRVEAHKKFFEEDAKCGVDESKRPGKPKTAVDLFGMEGSFRQLSVD